MYNHCTSVSQAGQGRMGAESTINNSTIIALRAHTIYIRPKSSQSHVLKIIVCYAISTHCPANASTHMQLCKASLHLPLLPRPRPQLLRHSRVIDDTCASFEREISIIARGPVIPSQPLGTFTTWSNFKNKSISNATAWRVVVRIHQCDSISISVVCLGFEAYILENPRIIPPRVFEASYCRKSLHTLMKAPGPPSSASSLTRASVC